MKYAFGKDEVKALIIVTCRKPGIISTHLVRFDCSFSNDDLPSGNNHRGQISIIYNIVNTIDLWFVCLCVCMYIMLIVYDIYVQFCKQNQVHTWYLSEKEMKEKIVLWIFFRYFFSESVHNSPLVKEMDWLHCDAILDYFPLNLKR